MSQYDNTNRFALFKNTNKRDDKDADYSGSVNIDGREFWLNGWIKEGAKGKFFSGTVKPKAPPPAEQSISQRAMPKGPAKRSIIPDDDMGGDAIPF
jgi:hypothetical protein